jgi:cold-inducible RNA-binding protein
VKKIYVGNLSYDANEQDLEKLFNDFGKNLQIKLIKDLETGRSKGFAFIEFENNSNAQAALQTDGKEFQGRRLKVSIAKDKRPRSPRERDTRQW